MNQSLCTRSPLPFLAGVFVFTGALFLCPAMTMGQGLDDLFAFSDEALFGNSEVDSEVEPTRVAFQNRPESKPDRFVDEAPPSRALDNTVRSSSDMRLVDSPGSQAGAHRQRPTAMEIRQARAMAESRARIARIEAARWGLRPTLRPNWVSDPMTASRFPVVQTYIVPVYVRTR